MGARRLRKGLLDSKPGKTDYWCEKREGLKDGKTITSCKWRHLPGISAVVYWKTDNEKVMQWRVMKFGFYLLWIHVCGGKDHYCSFWDPCFVCLLPPRKRRKNYYLTQSHINCWRTLQVACLQSVWKQASYLSGFEKDLGLGLTQKMTTAVWTTKHNMFVNI